MAKTRQLAKKNSQRISKLPGGAQTAESFLKNGSKNAAKVLKKSARSSGRASKSSRSELRNKIWRHKVRPRGIADPTLLVKEAVAQSKHQTYYEIVENTEKKKKLEFKVTNDAREPPGFTFVPVGDPELTQACKELSREQDCLIFVVSVSTTATTGDQNDMLSDQMNRIGYHFRSTIVDEASAMTNIDLQSVRRGGVNILQSSFRHNQNNKEKYPLPPTQEGINAQADAAIRDLFPRIPNTDRQEIINHAFQLGKKFAGKPVVGLQEDVPLPRRIQLAVLAHIRHTHTRYDKLLRETDWATARATIEASCLEILVKWRGDEETGRDQMDEVLREVVVISDSEDSVSDSEETSNDDEVEEGEVSEGEANLDVEMEDAQQPSVPSSQQSCLDKPYQQEISSPLFPHHSKISEVDSNIGIMHQHGTRTSNHRVNKTQRNERKGFKRYKAWNEAISRHHNNSDSVLGTRAQDYPRQMTLHRQGLFDHGQPSLPTYPMEPQRITLGQEYRLQTITPRQATFHPGELIDLTESSYGKKVMSRPISESSSHFQPYEQRDSWYGYGNSPWSQQTLAVRDRAAPSSTRPLSPPKSILQDYLLPSIEEAPDRALEDQHLLPDMLRHSEVSHRPALEPLSRGLTLMSDGTYVDAYGVVRTKDGRRVIYIDENNREVTSKVETSWNPTSKYGEGSTSSRTLSLMSGNSGHSNTTYHDSMVVGGFFPSSNTVSTHGHASSEYHAGRPILLENRPYSDIRDTNGTRPQSGLSLPPEFAPAERQYPDINLRKAEVYRPRLVENHGRGPGELSHVVRPSIPSRFSEKNIGIAHPEQFSHSSFQLRESIAYDDDDFEEPVLVSQRIGGSVRYFEEPRMAMATRSNYDDPLPLLPRRSVPAASYGMSRELVSEYIDLDRPMTDYGKNTRDQYTSHSGVDNQSDIIPMGQHTPFYTSRVPSARQYIAGHDRVL